MAAVGDIGIDFGTSHVIIYERGKGTRLIEPSAVAMERDTGIPLEIGETAESMIGRVPAGVQVVRPLRTGTAAEFDSAMILLTYLVRKVIGKRMFNRPRAVLSVPSGVNRSEIRGLISALLEAGVRRTQLLDRPCAAAIGAGVDITGTYGSMIIDIGAGVTDIAVITLGRVIRPEKQAPVQGSDAFDEAIIRYIRRKHNMIIGERSAEQLKISIGTAVEPREETGCEVTGRDLISGLPRLKTITSGEIFEAIDEPLSKLTEDIQYVLENTPTEVAGDMVDNGIVLTGGGALLSGLSEAITDALGIKCRVANDPQEAIARGCGVTLERMSEYGRFLRDVRDIN